MALDVEGVVDGSVCGKEFLGRTRALEPLHLALPPPRRLMRIFSSVVLPSPALMPSFDPKLSSRGAVGSQIVGDQPIRSEGILLQELAHQFQCGVLVSLGIAIIAKACWRSVNCLRRVFLISTELSFLSLRERRSLAQAIRRRTTFASSA